MGEDMPLAVDMAHACLFDPDHAAADLNRVLKDSSVPANYPSLAGRVVFVTGGASGIGADIVGPSPANGAKVAFVDIQDEAGEALVANRRPAAPLTCTATSPTSRRCRQRSREVGETLGPIAVLVNNAANDERHKIDEVTAEYWDKSPGRQPAAPVLRRAGGAAADAGARRRLDHQFLLDRLARRRRHHCGLCHRQGRRSSA